MRSTGLRHPARLAGASLLRMQSDERLAELASAGHESAFDAIVDRYRTPLLRYCSGIVGPSRAEDAVQQALINAHDALKRTDEVRNLRSWLYRIAHNAALNVLRAVRDEVSLDEHVLQDTRSAAASPAESYERSEQFRSTLAALQALPERQRAALVLRELEGRSHEEIAAALGVTKGSARQHLMRARVAVRSAVTALTPYPLIARLAEWTSAGGASGWVDGAAGAGAGASLAKLTAGLAATGALVGGAVGTEHIVRGGSDARAVPRAAERSVERPVKREGGGVVVPAAAAPASASARRQSATSGSSRSSSGTAKGRKRRSPSRSANGGASPAATSAPKAPSTTGGPGRDDAAQGAERHASEHANGNANRGRQTSSHANRGRQTSSHGGDKSRSGGGGTTKADKKPKHENRKTSKSDAPGQTKKAPAATGTSGQSDGSGKQKDTGQETTSGSSSAGSGSSDPSSSAEDKTSAKAPTETVAAATPSLTTSDED